MASYIEYKDLIFKSFFLRIKLFKTIIKFNLITFTNLNKFSMHHKPAVEMGVDNASAKKAKLGVWFFFIYLFFYGGFVAIGVLNYEMLSIKVVAGLNLAVFYGMGLIVFAVLLGILYNFFCSRYEDDMNTDVKEDIQA